MVDRKKSRRPNYSQRRRGIALSMIRAATTNPGWKALEPGDRIWYALGLIVCDEDGHFKLDDVEAAWDDPDAHAYALDLLDKAGA